MNGEWRQRGVQEGERVTLDGGNGLGVARCCGVMDDGKDGHGYRLIVSGSDDDGGKKREKIGRGRRERERGRGGGSSS